MASPGCAACLLVSVVLAIVGALLLPSTPALASLFRNPRKEQEGSKDIQRAEEQYAAATGRRDAQGCLKCK
eukprot:5936878-Pleurochrysis_carterae.AAC.1